MRFEKKKQPKIGESRIRVGFLFIPKTLPVKTRIGTKEGKVTRWLEKASWTEEYSSRGGWASVSEHYWKPLYWLDI